MSRCFPYPPPGYQLKNGVHDLALIESIKREKKVCEKEKKELKKREKKHKKERSGENGESKKKERKHDKKHKLDQVTEDRLKKTEDESTQLEKSGLTDEHEQPTNTQNLYDSSDSTQNSNKRKSISSPLDSCRTPGNSILIRLPLLKHKDPVSPTSKGQVYSISGNIGNVSNKKDDISARICQQQSCSTSGRNQNQAQDTALDIRRTSVSKSGSRGSDLWLRDLIENWVPPSSMEIDNMNFDDQEWLFEVKQRGSHEAKRFKPSFSHGSTDWPRACYLPTADIYALPYTVPF